MNKLIDTNMLIPMVAIITGGAIAIVTIIITAIRGMTVSRAKEQTKRELAAYVAEGTLDPDKAVAMINAGRPHWEAGQQGGKGGCCG